MPLSIAALAVHPQGEVVEPRTAAARAGLDSPLTVDTPGRRFQVEWDPDAAVTPLGQVVFFSQFLATAGLFGDWVQACPLKFSSNHAPLVPDFLGTITLAILAGQNRYAHVTALRADTVNPEGLGMSRVCSEDSVRRAFAEADPQACAAWQTGALPQVWRPALRLPWVMDLDVTVKPIYGHQEGAEIGYNPHQPGRPSHACHTLFVRGLRLVLDVEVRSGKQHSATHGRENLWRVWDALPKACRPWLACGDASYGHEGLLAQCGERTQKYLFRLRQSPGVKQLVRLLESQGGWRPARHGYEGAEGQLQLSGWTAKRRVIVLRRLRPAPRAWTGPGENSRHCPRAAVVGAGRVRTRARLPIPGAGDQRERGTIDRGRSLPATGRRGEWVRRIEEPMGLGRLHHEGSAALPDRGPERGADLQLVEFVRALRRAGAAARSAHEPSAAPVRSGPDGGKRTATELAADQHARPSRASPAALDGREPVFERTGEHCGAVETRTVLGTDLGGDFGTVAAAQGRFARPQRLKELSAKPPTPQSSAQPVEPPDRFSAASPQPPDLGRR